MHPTYTLNNSTEQISCMVDLEGCVIKQDLLPMKRQIAFIANDLRGGSYDMTKPQICSKICIVIH